MDLMIGDKLRQYRRQRGLTQEELAAHLGVSYQAISKWERREGYPDITLLPALAGYFGITVDELLGVSELASRTRYDAVNREWSDNNERARNEEGDALHRRNVELMRDALRQYPNDALLLVQLSTSLEKLHGTPEEREAHLRESVLLQEQILRGEDSEVRGATLFNICFAYEKLGEHDKALAAADRLPNLYKARENAFVSLTQGEQKRAAARSALPAIAYVIRHHLNALEESARAELILDILAGIQGE